MAECGGLERTDFLQFLLWEGVEVLKELILTADRVAWINLINFKKITNILVILNTCNSSIFFLPFDRNLLLESTESTGSRVGDISSGLQVQSSVGVACW